MTTHRTEEPPLFDLPLAPPPGGPHDEQSEHREVAPRRGSRRATAAHPESLPLFEEGEGATETPERAAPERRFEATAAEPLRRPMPVPDPVRAPAAEEHATAPLAPRVRASAGDLLVLLAVGGIAAVGAQALGAPLGWFALAPLGCFLLAFSFLYSVVSLAFWGQTPGMAWSGLVARTDATEPLSFGQTAMRWLGSWLTWALAGLPGLLALSGRSLADRISRSETFLESDAGAPA